MKTMKKFDCVKMKDLAQRRRAEALRGLTAEQRMEFYRRIHEALLKRQERIRQRLADGSYPDGLSGLP